MAFSMIRLSVIILLVELNFIKCEDRPNRRVFYGTDAKIENFPYFAGLSHCGAAIISDKWILTAAHCVSTTRKANKQTDLLMIRDIRRQSWQRTIPRVWDDKTLASRNDFVWVGGETFQNSQRVRYDHVIIHPEYRDAEIPINDVAVIRLSKPLTFSSKIKSIPLVRTPSRSTNVIFVGRGRDETGQMSKNLQKLNLVQLTIDQCIKQMPRHLQPIAITHKKALEKINICARRPEDKPGICDGDSGSPLSSNNVLIGLASYGGKNCRTSRLGFYVNLITYVPWIKSVTGV